jgi:multidrug efflux pump subunit AcrA (membrane-fusion protein)
MKRGFFFFALLSLAFCAARADDAQVTLTPTQLDELAKSGCFTPAFQSAVHDLIDCQLAADQAKADAGGLSDSLPDLQAQAEAAEAALAEKRKTLALYTDAENSDFTALNRLMADNSAKPQDQVAAAQAFLWIYPTSPHATEAQQDLTTAQNRIAAAAQAVKDAEAARLADQQKQLARAKAHDFSLDEWSHYLAGKSQEDLVGLIGRPTVMNPDLWVYAGAWATTPRETGKVGMQVIFNGGRVTAVAEGPTQ